MMVRIYTGPTIVKQIADKVREAGYGNVTDGTEHVYFEMDQPALEAGSSLIPKDKAFQTFIDKLKEVHQVTFGFEYKDFEVL